MKGFKDGSGKFRPTENKNGIRMKRDKSINPTGSILSQKRMKRETISRTDSKIKQLEMDFNKGLKQYNFDDKRLKNLNWDVDITYTGSYGSVSDEHFELTAFAEGVGMVKTREAFSNDDWYDQDDERLSERIQNDSVFAEKKYDEWLAEMLDAYQEGMFQNLVSMIEENLEYKQNQVE